MVECAAKNQLPVRDKDRPVPANKLDLIKSSILWENCEEDKRVWIDSTAIKIFPPAHQRTHQSEMYNWDHNGKSQRAIMTRFSF